ncbi:hypothetical protein ACLB2K_038346 [Fragaria x ananassa]
MVNEDVPDTAEPEAAGAANDGQENQVQDDHDQGEPNQEEPNQDDGDNPYFKYILLTGDGEPECFEEAKTQADDDKWILAMKSEMESLLKNGTYELVELLKGRKALKNKWVFKLKRDENEQLTKFKARLVVKGFGQKEGVYFDEIFSPVVKMTSIRVILGIAASMDLEVEQLDVKTAFLHGDLEDEIYMEQPEGFEVEGKEHMVCKLKKSLYVDELHKRYMSYTRLHGWFWSQDMSYRKIYEVPFIGIA